MLEGIGRDQIPIIMMKCKTKLRWIITVMTTEICEVMS